MRDRYDFSDSEPNPYAERMKRQVTAEDHKQALPTGFRLGTYRVARVLGAGGFGVTYLCEHTGLGIQVAVKEYLPNEIAVRDGTEVHPKSSGDREGFEWGLSRFLDEARTLARFEHPNVVRVRDCFEANNTAYIVMDYEDGEPFDVLLRRLGTLTEAQLKRVLLPVVDGLRQVHAAGFLHRDIKPANVFVRRSDESPVLLDFGSARQALGRRSRSVTAIASAGYSPPEQYESDGDHGAWTDIYALSALCYRAITGERPMEATRRQSQLLRTQTDPLPKLANAGREGYSPAFLKAVDWGLRLIETERPQSLGEWLPWLRRATTPRQPRDSEPTQVSSLANLHHGATEPKVGERFRDCAECPEMVVVPAGSFLMGSPESEWGRDGDEGPVHRVEIAEPFAIGVYEVTFAEWDACAADGGCGGYLPDDEGWGRGRRPVINVSWEDAQAYVRWLSAKTGKRYRLPSESEWEYAARAGTRTPFHTGETISTDQANCYGKYYRDQTVPVDTFGANEWGLHDVHGNVSEWTEDCWNNSYAGAPTDGSVWTNGDCSRRVLRGGSWYITPSFLRAANRIRNTTGYRSDSIGFRVARTLAS